MLEINKNTITIDRNVYWDFGSDQIDMYYPCRFPTVTIALMDTDMLNKIADAIRMEMGYLPMFPDEGYTGEYDCNGWYNFYVGLNGYNDSKVDSCIEFTVCASDANDNEQRHIIDLMEQEQYEIYKVLDEQLKEWFGTSCKELLEEARQEMMEDEDH